MTKTRRALATGPRDVSLRGLRFVTWGLVVAALAALIAYRPDGQRIAVVAVSLGVLVWLLQYPMIGLETKRRLRRPEAAAIVATTVLYVLAALTMPFPVGSAEVYDGLQPGESSASDILGGAALHAKLYHSQDTYNAVVPALFGHHASLSSAPWLPVSVVLFLLGLAATGALWVHAARIPLPRRGTERTARITLE